jgi:RNA polymerase sigma factor (sigma-70 family)
VSLLGRLRATTRDEEAWRLFNLIYSPLLLRWLRRWNLQDADKEDILQEVMLAVCANLSDFVPDGNPRSFRRWLWTILANRANARGRTWFRFVRRSRTLTPVLGTGDTALSRLLDQEHARIVTERALDSIYGSAPSREREIFCRLVGGESAADVAKAFGITRVDAYQKKSRGMSKFREIFGGIIDSC